MQVSDQIIKVINELCDKFGVVIDWTNKNILPQIQQFIARYISYKMAVNISGLVIGFIFIVAVIVFSIILIKGYVKKNQNIYTLDSYNEIDDVTALGLLLLFATVIFGIIGFIVFGVNCSGLLKDIFIPEIRIINEITRLI